MNMPRGREITYYEREKIEVWLRMKKKKTWIANKLNRNYSIIKREIKRNTGDYLSYNAQVAHVLAYKRARNTNTRKLDKEKNKELKEFIEKKLKDDWSPEQIVGYLEENKMSWICDLISHETIYQHIYEYSEKYKKLYLHLRRSKKKRQKRYYRKKQVQAIKNRVSIHERPLMIEKKLEYGHWETDLVEFKKGNNVICVNYEKKSMLCRIYRSYTKQATENENHIAQVIDEFSYVWCRSFTRDNGKENALHEDTLYKYDIPSYFCDANASWQKGGVENINGLIRQYLPKKCNINNITDKEILIVQEKLNNRPRKSLNYLTPNQVYALDMKKGL